MHQHPQGGVPHQVRAVLRVRSGAALCRRAPRARRCQQALLTGRSGSDPSAAAGRREPCPTPSVRASAPRDGRSSAHALRISALIRARRASPSALRSCRVRIAECLRARGAAGWSCGAAHCAAPQTGLRCMRWCACGTAWRGVCTASQAGGRIWGCGCASISCRAACRAPIHTRLGRTRWWRGSRAGRGVHAAGWAGGGLWGCRPAALLPAGRKRSSYHLCTVRSALPSRAVQQHVQCCPHLAEQRWDMKNLSKTGVNIW